MTDVELAKRALRIIDGQLSRHSLAAWMMIHEGHNRRAGSDDGTIHPVYCVTCRELLIMPSAQAAGKEVAV